jgi:hypothetical protein
MPPKINQMMLPIKLMFYSCINRFCILRQAQDEDYADWLMFNNSIDFCSDVSMI